MLRVLRAHFDLDVACTSAEPVDPAQRRTVESLADRLAIEPLRPQWCALRAAGAVLSGQAITPAWHWTRPLARTIRRWHLEAPFDAVLTSCTGMVRYALDLMNANPTAEPSRTVGPGRPLRRPAHVLDLMDVDSLKWQHYGATSRAPRRWLYELEARRIRRIERATEPPADALVVISDAEADAYRQHVGNHPNLIVASNGVGLDRFQPLADGGAPTLLFVGVLNYRPNVEGIGWFVRHVLPALRRPHGKVQRVRLIVVGRHPTAAVKALGKEPGVQIVGSVPDVRPYLERSSVVIAPLRIAQGVQNKVLEAMASARAVVASPQAAQGISAESGQHLMIADEPSQWVQQIETLLCDALHRRRIAAAARQRVEQVYDWSVRLAPIVEQLKQLTGSESAEHCCNDARPAGQVRSRRAAG